MNGTIIPIMSRRTIDLSNTSASQNNEIVLVKAVDVSLYTEGELYVRVHGGTIGGSATCTVSAVITSPTPEEPASDFIYDTAMATIAFGATQTNNAPMLLRGALTSNFGGMLAIMFKATQDPSTPQTIAPEISVELVVKS